MTCIKVKTKDDCVLQNVCSVCCFTNSEALRMVQYPQEMVRKVSMTRLRD